MSWPKGEVNQEVLCYPQCKEGYTGNAFLCLENCPAKFNDEGTFCKKKQNHMVEEMV